MISWFILATIKTSQNVFFNGMMLNIKVTEILKKIVSFLSDARGI